MVGTDDAASGDLLLQLAERVQIAVSRGGGASAVSRKTGIPVSTLHNWMKARSSPAALALGLLANAAEVDTAWLVHGVGDLRKVSLDDRSTPLALGAEGFTFLPRYDVKLAAGAGTTVESEQVVDYLAFKTSWIANTLRRPPNALILVEAQGDSMTPTIEDGDLLLVDTSDTRVRDNAIYALGIGEVLVVKRVQRLLSGELRVSSDNPAYQPETVSADHADRLRVIGQVLWRGGRV